MRKTIILIHGYAFDQRSWDPVEIAFDGFQTIRFSLPGFGSEAPREPYTIASLAKQYWSKIGPSVNSEVHLVGHSMGGYVCIEMAAQHPSRVASLSLIHSHVFEDGPEKKTQRTAIMEDIMTNGHYAIAHKMIPSLFASAQEFTPLVDALVARGLSYDDRAWAFGAQAMRDRADHHETLAGLVVPVLMISGKKDNAAPAEVIYRQASVSANNTLVLYEDVGHMAMYENTAQLICDLRSFYTRMAN
jgi:pimeloyl-ACP methyl ester carboxylesterase